MAVTVGKVIDGSALFKTPSLTEVQIPGIGMVYMKIPSAGVLLEFAEQNSTEGEMKTMAMLDLMPQVLVDEDGKALLTTEQASNIGEISMETFNVLAKAILDMMKDMTGDDDSEGNESSRVSGDGSPTDSASN